MNAVTMLKEQHLEVDELFKRFDTADSPEQRRRIFNDIADALAVHATIEERHFYPAVKKRQTEGILRVVVLSGHKQTQDIVDALDAGAVGYVLKADPPATLMQALDRGGPGRPYLAPSLAGAVVVAKGRWRTGSVLNVLSQREREIFRLFADCRTAAEIARDLCIARKTVDAHLNRINRKLGLPDRAELVRLAVHVDLVHSLRHPVRDRGNGVAATAR